MTEKATVTVDLEPVGRRVEAKIGQSLLEVVRDLGLGLGTGGVTAPCGGRGRCGRCRVRVEEDGKNQSAGAAGAVEEGRARLSPPNDSERRLLSPKELEQGYRLACQATVAGPGRIKVAIPPESLTGVQKLQVEGEAVEVELDPPLRRYPMEFIKTTLEYPVPVLEQVRQALEEPRIDLVAMANIEPLAADGPGWALVRQGELVGVKLPGSADAAPVLGLAVDLGTTKVAGFLVDMETGQTLAASGIMNPQIAYGEDVMARLAYALEGAEKYHEIRQAIITGLNSLVDDLLQEAKTQLGAGISLSRADIAEAVIVGNTAMHHLLLGLPVAQLARAPYVPSVSAPVEVKARELGLKLAPGAYVYLAPNVAGFVGADHVAMVLGSRIGKSSSDPVVLGLDIGTNTEIVLAWRGQMMSCSCASGPAFEGAHIRYGMRAVTGAIEKVELAEAGIKVNYWTVGNAPPLGICGSGILDAVAEFYRHGVVDGRGRLRPDHPRVRRPSSGEPWEFVLVPREESGTGHDLVITQKDINEIQLAKAAIAAGTKLLLEAAGLGPDSISKVIVAGAFGTHLRLESAIAIGMLPDLPRERFRQVGNAAGTGARLLLISQAERRRAEQIAREDQYLELMLVPSFNDTFISELSFPSRAVDKRGWLA
ncbi:MAG: DUF4445 domain-containing protein [Clostridia bacterium]|nr:DUF4445 domain-containing protein [Clostridia bacterium]